MATWVELAGKRMKVELGGNNGSISVDGLAYAVDLQLLEPGVLSLLWTRPDGHTQSFSCRVDDGLDDPAVLIDGQRIPYAIYDPRSLRLSAAGAADTGPKPLKAPMPGRIVRVLVAEGDTVAAGQGCVVIEAMKMQNELKAPRAGIVRRLTAGAGDTVAAGTALLVVE